MEVINSAVTEAHVTVMLIEDAWKSVSSRYISVKFEEKCCDEHTVFIRPVPKGDCYKGDIYKVKITAKKMKLIYKPKRSIKVFLRGDMSVDFMNEVLDKFLPVGRVPPTIVEAGDIVEQWHRERGAGEWICEMK